MAKRTPDDEPSLWDLPEDTSGASTPPRPPGDTSVALHEAAQSRYLNYALSVITSRALPDVRDGLKPVQRRILFTMWQQNLTADAKHRKCAKVVGDVMGNFHPHGDLAIYETLVRLAQSFSLRNPLVDGSGNFGSLDGDNAAAMRYTECRLARLSDEMLTEIDQDTVPFRPNYDGTKTEPVVLPARLPNLLVNGVDRHRRRHGHQHPAAQSRRALDGAAAPHRQPRAHHRAALSLGEGTRLPHRRPDPELGRRDQGDLQDGQRIDPPARRLGDGPRESWRPDDLHHQHPLHGEQVGARRTHRRDRRVAGSCRRCVDVRDVSTDDVRIELTIKRDADAKLVMVYLWKQTPLQTTFPVNMTCLVPTENAEVGRPERLDLHQMLWYFLKFRLDVVTARLEHELGALKKRIHILEGFEKVFDALDEILRIVRKADGKADAAEKIIARFGLDAEQTDAILELKIYRLARLEILVITNELAEKRRRARQIGGLLKSEQDRWDLVRDEIAAVQKHTPIRRRTRAARSSPPTKTRSSSRPTTSSSTKTTSSSSRATAG